LQNCYFRFFDEKQLGFSNCAMKGLGEPFFFLFIGLFIHLFICACIVWTISLPPLPPFPPPHFQTGEHFIRRHDTFFMDRIPTPTLTSNM
jgi:hypothetical protein